jgi:hypothetical protein
MLTIMKKVQTGIYSQRIHIDEGHIIGKGNIRIRTTPCPSFSKLFHLSKLTILVGAMAVSRKKCAMIV